MRRSILVFAAMTALVFSATSAHAEGWSLGVGLGIVNAGQDDMDKVITAGGSSAGDIGNGMEVVGSFGYSFGDMDLLFKPGYYWVTEEGGADEYSMNAISLFPMLKFNLLSNNTITFYAQLGLGIVMMNGEVKEGAYSVEFSGNQFGYSGGLGSEFCFWADHCFFLEANLRVASVDRMKVDSVSGTNSNSAITQDGDGQEFEINNQDFSGSLSGIQGLVGYSLKF
jgi:hypothetical protein